ncbi:MULTISPECIES: hypothetical protein [unclassified Streptomyces]|uniref:hypothetical protein n=1 Tax=unclassified Streptomyces TaxID=2593676 RepID=UPI003413C2CB
MSDDAQRPTTPRDAAAWAPPAGPTPAPADGGAPERGTSPEQDGSRAERDAAEASGSPERGGAAEAGPTAEVGPASESGPVADAIPGAAHVAAVAPDHAAPAPSVAGAFGDGPGHPVASAPAGTGDEPRGSVPAQGPAPFAAPVPDARVSLGKREADAAPEFDPWAPPEEITSFRGPARGSTAPPPAYGLPAITALPGAPAPPAPGNHGAAPWDNPFAPPAGSSPFAPPAARTPYPQPVPGEPVPPPPIAPDGPGLPYGYGYGTGYPQYPAPHGYGWPVRQPMPSNGLGTAGLVLGIIAAVLFVVWPLAILLGVLAVIFGLIGGAKARRGEATNSGQALAGVICGAVGLVLAIGVFVAIVVFSQDHGSTDSGGDGFSTSLVTHR